MNRLIIGNKNYSSWSLRPWLLLKEKNIRFEETRLALYQENSKDELLKYSKAGKVPVFYHQGTCVWDSLAICEYIAELNPDKSCWPQNKEARAWARAISSEMHSGFFEIRNRLPMNCRKTMKYDNITADLQSEIERVQEIWNDCRKTYSNNGGFLFGDFSIADAMYAPVVLRFNSYGISVGDAAAEYMKSILSLSAVKSWMSAGIKEPEVITEAEI